MKDIIVNVHLTESSVILPDILPNAVEYAIQTGARRVNVYATPKRYTLYRGRARDCEAFQEYVMESNND